MSDSISKSVLLADLPTGSLWNPKPDGGLDQLLDGIAASHESIMSILNRLSTVRNPEKSPILTDLEREFGLENNSLMTTAQRRGRLKAVKADKSGDGTAYLIEQRLRASGFDVSVHINSPSVDPSRFVVAEWYSVCGNEDAVCGYEDAICGISNGLFIVNGNAFNNYDIFPLDSHYWPLIFFVGGPVTRNESGEITNIELADIPIERADEFLRLIVKYKPLHSWAGAVAYFYTSSELAWYLENQGVADDLYTLVNETMPEETMGDELWD